MAVNWLWKNELGYMKYHINWNGEKSVQKTKLYEANCLGCEIYHNDKEHYTFKGFWGDEKHLRNLIKDDFYNEDWKQLYEVGLNTYFYEDAMKIAKEFAKAKIKVVLYYKEIKA